MLNNDQRESIQHAINSSFEEGLEAGRIQNLDAVKHAEIERLKARIAELEGEQPSADNAPAALKAQMDTVGHKNPMWEAGAQWGLYTMPDEIAIAYARLSSKQADNQAFSYQDLKNFYDLVRGVMRGYVRRGN